MSVASLLEAGAGKLGVRFFLVDLVPTAALMLFVAGLQWSGAPSERPAVDRVTASIADFEAGEGLAALTAVLFVALLLGPLQPRLVRLLEGYWGSSRLAHLATRPLVARHARRRGRLEAQTRTESPAELTARTRAAMVFAGLKRRQLYPDRMLMPTALGNALRSAEERAGAPYGLDAVAVWPHLYPLVGERLAAGLDEQRNQLDLAVRLVWTLAAATVAALAYLVQHDWWLLVPAATAVLAALAYRAAVAAAIDYGRLVQVALDLHRFDLLRALHCPLPRSAAEERELNRGLSPRLMHRDWEGFEYRHPS